jgi:hypothetical protein
MKYLIHHIDGLGNFEVEALTKTRLRALIEAECHDRNWIVDDTWAEEIKPEAKKMPYWRQKSNLRKEARNVHN